ncbi:uncharacterized protein LOC144289018 isoform X2 [Canis aureus]
MNVVSISTGKDRIKMNIKTLLKKKKTLLFWAVETIESKPILDNICLAGRNMQNIHSFSNGSSPEAGVKAVRPGNVAQLCGRWLLGQEQSRENRNRGSRITLVTDQGCKPSSAGAGHSSRGAIER